VVLPPGVNEDEWIASQVHSIYVEACHLMPVLEDLCDCDVMSAGTEVQYSWVDETDGTTQFLSAVDYSTELLTYVDTILDNEAIFPPGGAPFPHDFRAHVSKILRRLFRLYAHMYLSHFAEIREYEGETHLNRCFQHFLFFVLEFGLVTRTEMAPLHGLINKFLLAVTTSMPQTEADVLPASNSGLLEPGLDQGHTGFSTCISKQEICVEATVEMPTLCYQLPEVKDAYPVMREKHGGA